MGQAVEGAEAGQVLVGEVGSLPTAAATVRVPRLFPHPYLPSADLGPCSLFPFLSPLLRSILLCPHLPKTVPAGSVPGAAWVHWAELQPGPVAVV